MQSVAAGGRLCTTVLTGACGQDHNRCSCAGPLTVSADKQRLVCEQGVQALPPSVSSSKSCSQVRHHVSVPWGHSGQQQQSSCKVSAPVALSYSHYSRVQ
ncbi:hypothetical protein ABBQ38_001832 [Trebouxia sp. C0009 RCD-2024]